VSTYKSFLQSIDWWHVLKTATTCVALPWAVVALLLVWLAPGGEAQAVWHVYVGAALIGVAYFGTPAAAAYVAARFAKDQPLAHAVLAVGISLLAYVFFFEESLFAVAVWPVMGLLGALPSLRKARAEA